MATVVRCTVCKGEAFRRYGAKVDEIDGDVTEFAECLSCGRTYLYRRPATKAEREGAGA